MREGNDAPAEENNDHQREFSGQGFLLYELQGIFPADQNSTDHKQQKEQDQVGSVQQGRLEQIDPVERKEKRLRNIVKAFVMLSLRKKNRDRLKKVKVKKTPSHFGI